MGCFCGLVWLEWVLWWRKGRTLGLIFDGMGKVMNGYGCRFGFRWVLWLGGLGVGVAEVAACMERCS